jgi:ribokinase
MARDVYVVGSVNLDLVVRAATLPGPGETVTGGTFERHGGGKSANQAVAAARQGAAVRMIAAVGTDDLGDEAIADLEAEGIDVSGVARVDTAATGVALIVVDDGGENQIAVASGANAELSPEAVEAALAGAAAGAVALLGLEVPDAPVLAAARAARAAGLEVVLNPAPARPLPAELLALSPVLTPNEPEAAALSGESDPEAAARALTARTGAPVVVTVGPQGALLADGDDVERIPAPAVDAVDTTGAGDAFNGALAAALAGGAALADAVREAVAVAAEAVRRPGARG